MSKLTRTLLKAENDNNITTNANQEITGEILNNLLEDLVDSVHFDEDAYTKSQIDTLFSSGNTLDALEDVNISTLATGNLLVYNGTEWVNSGFSYENITATDYYFIFSSGNTLTNVDFYYEHSNDALYCEHGLVVGTSLEPRGIDIKGQLDVSDVAEFNGEFISNSLTESASILNPFIYLGDYIEFGDETMIFDVDNNYFEVNVDINCGAINSTGRIIADTITGATMETTDITVTGYLYTSTIEPIDTTVIVNGNLQVYGYNETYGSLYVQDSNDYGVQISATNGYLKIDVDGDIDTNNITCNTKLEIEGGGSQLILGADYSVFGYPSASRYIELDGSNGTRIYDSNRVDIAAYTTIGNGTESVDLSSGSLIINGGEAISGNLYLGGKMNIATSVVGEAEGDIWIEDGHLNHYNEANSAATHSNRIAYDTKPHVMMANNNDGGGLTVITTKDVWTGFTRASKIFTVEGAVGISGLTDRIQIKQPGHYLMLFQTTISGDDNVDFRFRFRNVTQGTTINAEVGVTTTGANNRVCVTMNAYARSLNVNDIIMIEIVNSTNTTNPTFYGATWMTFMNHYIY
jgi:hypothetical protein